MQRTLASFYQADGLPSRWQVGNYLLQRQLGTGGFATVYLAKHVVLGHQIACKILNRLRRDRTAMQRFLLEAHLLTHLRHRSIVKGLDFGYEQDTPFLVMEYASGGPADQLFPPERPQPVWRLLPIVHQIATALDYIHSKGVVHCDVKPANILLGPHHEVWLADFGIASILASTAKEVGDLQGMRGTPMYVAPEQLLGTPLPASDQYALGVMVYQWLCGHLPFEGSWLQVCVQHVSTPPSSLRNTLPSIARQVEHVVLKALEKEPHKRFPSVTAFAFALEEASCQGKL